jgi:hypothetical protein
MLNGPAEARCEAVISSERANSVPAPHVSIQRLHPALETSHGAGAQSPWGIPPSLSISSGQSGPV